MAELAQVCLLQDLDFTISCFALCPSKTGVELVVGGTDGWIRFYHLQSQEGSQKMKAVPKSTVTIGSSGPRILLPTNVSRLNQTGTCDILAGSADGSVMIICEGQLLWREQLSHRPVSLLAVDRSVSGEQWVIAADGGGNIKAMWPDPRWSLALSGAPRCMISLSVPIKGVLCSYFLVANESAELLLVANGSILRTISTSSRIASMCIGLFEIPVPASHSNTSGTSALNMLDEKTGIVPVKTLQVALGGLDGIVYFLDPTSLVIRRGFKVGFSIKTLRTLQQISEEEAVKEDAENLIACCGHFDGFRIFRSNGVCSRTVGDLEEWVEDMTTCSNQSQSYIGVLSTNRIAVYSMSGKHKTEDVYAGT